MARRKAFEYALVALVAALVFAVAGGVAFARWSHGLSARDEPAGLEKFVARRLRTLAHAKDIRRLTNPVPASPEAIAEARAHFADHCAICHGNDGRGRTEIGQRLYPRAPDMTLAETQSMTDGELFHVIKYGVRLTGMPARGDENSHDDDLASWKLVHFVRHLPQITPAELEEMNRLNPKSHEETISAEEEEQFLEGEDTPPSASPSPPSPTPHANH